MTELTFDSIPKLVRVGGMALMMLVAACLWSIPAAATACLFVAPLWLLPRNDLRLDFTKREYSVLRGFWPTPPHVGPFDQLEFLRVERQTLSGSSHGAAPIIRYALTLHWKESQALEPYPVAKATSLPEAAEIARRLAGQLGVPVQEGQDLQALRKEILSADYGASGLVGPD